MRKQLLAIVLVGLSLPTACDIEKPPSARPTTDEPSPPIPYVPSTVPASHDGIYSTSKEIGGFSGTILEINNGRFRYWFWSDVRRKTEPTYPVSGNARIRQGAIFLDDPQVNQQEWYPETINGIAVLMRNDAREAWHAKRAIYEYGI